MSSFSLLYSLTQNCWSRITPGECKYLWWKWDVYPHNDESRGRIKLKEHVWFPDYCVDFWHIHACRLLEGITHIWWKFKVKWSHSVMSEGRWDVNYCKRSKNEVKKRICFYFPSASGFGFARTTFLHFRAKENQFELKTLSCWMMHPQVWFLLFKNVH